MSVMCLYIFEVGVNTGLFLDPPEVAWLFHHPHRLGHEVLNDCFILYWFERDLMASQISFQTLDMLMSKATSKHANSVRGFYSRAVLSRLSRGP